MDTFTSRVSPGLRNMAFSSVTDSSRDSAFPSSVCFGSQPWLSLNVSRAPSHPACLLTHPGWAGQGRHLQGQSLTLGDAPGPSRRCREVRAGGSESKASVPTEPALKTPYSRNRGALPRAGKTVWLGPGTCGRVGTARGLRGWRAGS